MKVKKYIEIPEEILVGLAEGKYVEGSLHRDVYTGRLTFNVYNRKSREPGYQRPLEVLIHQSDFGQLLETPQRFKIRQSMPKKLGIARVMTIIDREAKEFKNSLIDREIFENV
jgi:hypothetical protein